jgi:lauroyl/myristoyl acyltransferase
MNSVIQLQKFGIALTKVIPPKCADRIAAAIGLVYCYLSKKKRGYIINNLRHIFHETPIPHEQFNTYVKNTFANFARAMVDFFRLSYITREDFDVEIVGGENLTQALSYKQGCVMLTMHLGNWDYAGAFLAAHGYPMSALVEETDPEMFNLYTAHRERTGMKTFPVTKAGYAFLHAIKQNRILAVLADRDIMKNGIPAAFFSGTRYIPRGLAEIIIKKRMPIVFAYLVFNLPERQHRYLGMIEAPIFFTGSIKEFNRLMVSTFERCIRQYPDQWFVFHPEWIS